MSSLALPKKLEQLAQREPPKNRKTAVDLLEPLRERIIALHRKGWSSHNNRSVKRLVCRTC